MILKFVMDIMNFEQSVITVILIYLYFFFIDMMGFQTLLMKILIKGKKKSDVFFI